LGLFFLDVVLGAGERDLSLLEVVLGAGESDLSLLRDVCEAGFTLSRRCWWS
jgi:hypothetical protein